MAFKVCKKGTCGITITDINEDYQTTSILTTTGNIYYTFTESGSVNAITSITYDNTRTLVESDITEHNVSHNDTTDVDTNITDESTLTFGSDGLYEVTHIILPTKDYVTTYIEQGLTTLFPNGIYYLDNKKIYKYGSNEEIEVAVLVELNTTGTTIIKETKNTFSLCHLQDCFYNLCKKLLSNLCGCNKDCNKTSTYSEDIFNRDLIWMAINVIKYAINEGQYYEAQRLLESIDNCGNICSQFDSDNNLNTSGCGCNR